MLPAMCHLLKNKESLKYLHTNTQAHKKKDMCSNIDIIYTNGIISNF